MSDEQINRWCLVQNSDDYKLIDDPKGHYVRYLDHKAAMEKKDAEIQGLNKALNDQHNRDWTPTIIDRLNVHIRESNGTFNLGIEIKSGDEAAKLVGALCGQAFSKDARIRELEEACKVLAEECRSHRDYPSDDEMNTGDPENEAVNLIRMARCGTAMDAVDAHPVAKEYVEGKE